jgi:ABC-type molybdate transport system substrate-binding protein
MVGLPSHVRDAPVARAFMDWLLGPRGQAIFARHGFVPAKDVGR